MKALIQRVTQASVTVAGETVGRIDHGLVVLLGIDKHDTTEQASRLVDKVLSYRVFADVDGRMNLNVQEVQGGVLIVSQFTLSADTHKGLRPSFTSAAPPELGRERYEFFVAQARRRWQRIETGRFGADMQVALINDGPVTFLLSS